MTPVEKTSITRCAVRDCVGEFGAISSVVPCFIDSCSFVANRTYSNGGYGGAVRIETNHFQGTAVSNCEFRQNWAPDAGALALYLSGTAVDTTFITGCVFDGNSASANGGAVRLVSPRMVFRDCEFTRNSADVSGGLCLSGIPM